MSNNSSEDASKDVLFKIPGMTIGTLMSMMAVSEWIICSGEQVANPGLRRAAKFMAQLVYEQSYEKAGADEVWKDEQDGVYYHPTFPEQQGEAWMAVEQYNDEIFAIKLVEMTSRLLAKRHAHEGMSLAECVDHYEHLLQDLLEEKGVEGVLEQLIA